MVFNVETDWTCPNCDYVRRTAVAGQHAVVHKCNGLHGLIAPMVRAGTKCKIEVKYREDYVGSEIVAMDPENRPVMAIVTTRDDGQDCRVLAPVAVGGGRGGLV